MQQSCYQCVQHTGQTENPDNFVAIDTPQPKATATATTRRKAGRPQGKKSNLDYTQLAVYLRQRTHLAAKKTLLEDSRKFSEPVEDLVTQWIGEYYPYLAEMVAQISSTSRP